MRIALGTLIAVTCLMVGCDYGDPAIVGSPGANADAQTLLIRWQVEGAIPAADVNGDGTVDIVDLVIVSQNFGKDVAVGALAVVPDIVWREEGGSPHGRVEVINSVDAPAVDMRLRYIARQEGLLRDVSDASLITALVPTPGQSVTYIAPGAHGTGWLWAAAIAWEDFETGAATIEVVVIRNEDSLIPVQNP
jgi:hypothetical protein